MKAIDIGKNDRWKMRTHTKNNVIAKHSSNTYSEEESVRKQRRRIVLGRIIIGVFLFAGWEFFFENRLA